MLNQATALHTFFDTYIHSYFCPVHISYPLLSSHPASTNAMPKKTEKNATKWSRSDEATLMHKLVEQKTKRNWGDNNLKTLAWTAGVIALAGSEKISGGTSKTMQAIKNRWQGVYPIPLLTG